MQHFLGDFDSGMLNLETHRLALAIAKKTLDENRLKTSQKTMAQKNPAFQVGDHVYFKNKQPSKWDLKWRPRYRMVCIEHNGHFSHIKNKATGKIQSCNVMDIILKLPIEFWNIVTQFSRAGRYINHPVNLLLCRAVHIVCALNLLYVCLGGNYTAYDSVYCNTQLLIFRFSFLCYT